MFLPLKAIWKVYQIFVKNALKDNPQSDLKDIITWRESLFIKIILYATPLSLLALIPSVIILLDDGYRFLPAYDVFILITIPTVAFNKSIRLSYKKWYVVAMFYLLAIIVFSSLGSFGVGSLYILALAAFITVLFNGRAIATSLIINICIYLFFAAVIYFKLFDSPLVAKYSIKQWVFYASNFLFLNIAVVMILRQITIGLEKKIIKEAQLRKTLQQGFDEKNVLNAQLIEAVSHYKSLFFSNPSPMWIFDPETLNFIQVNGATIRKYGYTRAEFKNMTIKDIRPVEDIEELLVTLDNIATRNGATVSTVKHLSKKGEVFYVEVRCSDIIFQGKIQRLVISRDITEQIERTKAIEKQNEQLREIAYMQSHVVRAPLSRILGLVNMLNANQDSQAAAEILGYLDTSAKELDDVIRAIINKTEGVNDI